MSLVMITGYPCSGKTMLARALKNALTEAEGNNKQVLHISDDDFPRFHRSIYEKPYEEGQLRSFLKSEVVKNLKADTIVIMDSLNYLKSFRYELYCAAKAAQVSYFLIRCGNKGWRSSFFNMIRPQEMRYKLTTVHDLVKRYELPEERNKWDQIQYTFCLMEELVPECAKKLYPLILQGKKLTSNRSTEAQPLASAEFLSELDRLTSAINTAIQERLSENPIGQKADVKRQFFAYVRMHPVEDAKVLANILMLNIDCVVGVDGESAFCFVPAKQAYVDQESDKRRGGSRLCLLLKVAEGNLQQS
ncbi:Protein KTI12 [Trichinella pseudospiralis]